MTDEESELADITESQLSLLSYESYDQMGMFVGDIILVAENELAGHFEVKNEHMTALAFEKDHLPAPPDSENSAGPDILKPILIFETSSLKRRGKEFDLLYFLTTKLRLEASDDGLDFGKFRHALILAHLPEASSNPLRLI